MAEDISARLTPAEGRRFGLLVGAAFVVLGGVARWRGHPTTSLVFWTLGGALLAGGLLIPGRLGPIHRGWMALALAISKVTTPIVMGIIYFVVITPAGVLLRWFGHRPLTHGSAAATAWVARSSGPSGRGDMKRQF